MGSTATTTASPARSSRAGGGNTSPPSAPPTTVRASCRRGPQPDTRCTPGKALAGVNAEQVCVPGYSEGVRNVPQSEKNKVYAEYGIRHHTPGSYEVDHLISLELGGSNCIKKLWPEKQPGRAPRTSSRTAFTGGSATGRSACARRSTGSSGGGCTADAPPGVAS